MGVVQGWVQSLTVYYCIVQTFLRVSFREHRPATCMRPLWVLRREERRQAVVVSCTAMLRPRVIRSNINALFGLHLIFGILLILLKYLIKKTAVS